MKGSYSIVVKREGRIIHDVKFDNIILNSAIDLLIDHTAIDINTSVLDTLFFGNGFTEPNPEDTTLSGSRVGTIKIKDVESTGPYRFTDGYNDGGNTIGNHDEYYITNSLIFESVTTTYGNFSEIAIGRETEDGYKLFSKTLIKRNGAAVILSVSPGDEILVIYTLVNYFKPVRNVKNSVLYSNTSIRLLGAAYGKAALVHGLRLGLNAWRLNNLTLENSRVGCTWDYEILQRNHSTKTLVAKYTLSYQPGSPGHEQLSRVYSSYHGYPSFKFNLNGIGVSVMITTPSFTANSNSTIKLSFNLSLNMSTGYVEVLKHNSFFNEVNEHTGRDTTSRTPAFNTNAPTLYIKPFTYVYGNNRIYNGVNNKYKVYADVAYSENEGTDINFISNKNDLLRMLRVPFQPRVVPLPEGYTSVYYSGGGYVRRETGEPVTAAYAKQRMIFEHINVQRNIDPQQINVGERGVALVTPDGKQTALGSFLEPYAYSFSINGVELLKGSDLQSQIGLDRSEWFPTNLISYNLYLVIDNKIAYIEPGMVIDVTLKDNPNFRVEYLYKNEFTITIPETIDDGAIGNVDNSYDSFGSAFGVNIIPERVDSANIGISMHTGFYGED